MSTKMQGTPIAGCSFLCTIEPSYLKSISTYVGLSSVIGPLFDQALTAIVQSTHLAPPYFDELEDEVASAARDLFALVHARFICTEKGLQRMEKKFANHDFGVCPRLLCQHQPVLPVGHSDFPHHGSVSIFCPQCLEVYCAPPFADGLELDGAHWGTTFPHLFMLFLKDRGVEMPLKRSYVPRVYGMRVHDPEKANHQERQQGHH